MDLQNKIINVLRKSLTPEYIRLEDDDGISGFVVSKQFSGIPTLDRQERIDAELAKASLTQDERRRVLMIAALTPEEYEGLY